MPAALVLRLSESLSLHMVRGLFHNYPLGLPSTQRGYSLKGHSNSLERDDLWVGKISPPALIGLAGLLKPIFALPKS